MSNATLLIAFSGLIAFVPNEARHPDFVTAYLVKMDNHEPKFRVPLSSLLGEQPQAQCSNSGCTVADTDYCDCSLKDADITFLQSQEQHRAYIRSAPFGKLPSSENSLHLSWLTRLANVGGTNTSLENIEENTTGSVVFGWVSASTCAFDEVVVTPTRRKVYTFDFLLPVQGQDAHVQAIAELVVFRGNLSSRRLTIQMVSRSGEPTKELKLSCEDGVCPVAISNRAKTYPDCRTCEECAKGEHFDRYYYLLANLPPNRPLPYRRCGAGQQVTIDAAPVELCPDLSRLVARGRAEAWELLLANELEDIRAVSNRVICPMAVLDP